MMSKSNEYKWRILYGEIEDCEVRSDKNELSQHSLHKARFSSIKRSVYNGLPVTTHSTDDHSIKFLKYF